MLRLPAPPLRLEGDRVLDLVRRRWVRLTPEEWVRQHAVWYLMERSGVPAALMAVEKAHKSHAGSRRSDVTVYDRAGDIWLVLECKAPSVAVGQRTLDQVARYAKDLMPRFIAVTNGMSLFCAERAGDEYAFVPSFPQFASP